MNPALRLVDYVIDGHTGQVDDARQLTVLQRVNGHVVDGTESVFVLNLSEGVLANGYERNVSDGCTLDV